jgi:hypothetical protein
MYLLHFGNVNSIIIIYVKPFFFGISKKILTFYIEVLNKCKKKSKYDIKKGTMQGVFTLTCAQWYLCKSYTFTIFVYNNSTFDGHRPFTHSTFKP